MSVRDDLRRHRWAVGAIVVASWGWALAWPQGEVTLTSTSSHIYMADGWGVHGAFRKGKNLWRLERELPGVGGREGWFVDWQALALACALATLLCVVSSAWWISFRTPAPLGASPGSVAVGVLGLAIWPALLGIGPVVGAWRQLGSVGPQGVTALHPEWMLVGTLYLVSVIAVRLGRPAS